MLWSSFAKGRGISPASISPATRRGFVFVVHCLQNDTCKIHVLIEERLSMLRQKEVEFFRCLFWCSPLFPRSNFNQRTPKRGTSDIIRMQQQSYEIMWVINKREKSTTLWCYIVALTSRFNLPTNKPAHSFFHKLSESCQPKWSLTNRNQKDAGLPYAEVAGIVSGVCSVGVFNSANSHGAKFHV